MSVRLRLRRMGKKKRPFYRIVVIDSRKARDARYIENLGTYNPLKNPAEIDIKEDRVLYWLGKGALPSDTVKSFCRRKGIMHKWHLIRNGADDAAIEEGMKQWEAAQLDRQKRQEALSEQQKRDAQKPKKESKAEEVKAEEPQEAKAEKPAAAEEQSAESAEAAAVETAAEPAEETTPAEAAATEVDTTADAEKEAAPAEAEKSAAAGDEAKPETEKKPATAKKKAKATKADDTAEAEADGKSDDAPAEPGEEEAGTEK